MKLKQYVPGTRPSAKPAVSIHESGVIRFNTAACEALNLQIGHQIGVFQDEESPKDWYIKAVKENGFTLRAGGKAGGLQFNSVASTVPFAKSLDMSGCINCLVATQHEDGYYAILTRSARANGRNQK